MVQGKWFAPGENPGSCLQIRQAVFSREQDSLDASSWNVLVLQDSLPAATGRIWWEDGSFRIGDICVLPELRGRMLGDLVLRLLLYKAQSHYARDVRLLTPRETASFFTRLGFTPIQEDSAAEVEMFIRGDRIELDRCKSCEKANCPNRHSDFN